MKAKEALQLLRDHGTLRTSKLAKNVVRPKQLDTPVAKAADELVHHSASKSAGRPWMPPSTFLVPLP